mgnify:CR=1 FL=1
MRVPWTRKHRGVGRMKWVEVRKKQCILDRLMAIGHCTLNRLRRHARRLKRLVQKSNEICPLTSNFSV